MRNEDAAVSTNHSVCDNPPPVIVMRRNLPNVNGKNVTINNDNSDNVNNSLKRLKTEEFVQVGDVKLETKRRKFSL